MSNPDGSVSFYFFDVDDNLLFLPTRLYLWNAERQEEQAVSSAQFAAVGNDLGRSGQWQSWTTREETFRDFRDQPNVPTDEQAFIRDLVATIASDTAWRGPAWPLLRHAATNSRPIAIVTARGHAPATIERGLHVLAERGLLPAIPPILGIYSVTNPEVRATLAATDPLITVPSLKKLAIKHAVDVALTQYGAQAPHRFGISDDDMNNVRLAISAMRDCKVKYPEKRFFVINTNEHEFVKLEIFPMAQPVTAPDQRLLRDDSRSLQARKAISQGGVAAIYVSDMDRAVAFYTNTLGLRLQSRVDDTWAEIDAGNGFVIGLHPANAASPSPGTVGATSIELRVDGPLDATVETLHARGVRFTGSIMTYPAVRIASFLDADDNVLQLVELLGGADAS